MFGFLNRLRIQSLFGSKYVGDYNTRFVYLLENASLTIVRPFSSTESVVSGNKNDLEEKIHSFTVSYLINSCGLSPAAASSLSSQVKFKSSIQPDSVLRVLRDQGFTDADISVLVRKQPKLLLANLGTTLSPKLEFFNSIGISNSDLVKVLCWNPTLLTRSLKNHLIPCYDFLKTLFLEDSCEGKVANVLKRASWIFLHHVQRNLAANVSTMRALGIPPSTISKLVTFYPGLMAENPDKYSKALNKVIEMGFDPKTSAFAHGLQAVTQFGQLKWDEKMDTYKRWGWTEDEIWTAFKKHPICIKSSKNKIMGVMDFLVNKMGWQSSDVAKIPTVLCYSLEKRIVPRCSVVRILHLKGLMTSKETALSSVVTTTDKYFLGKFVTKFQNEVPQLLDVLHGKISISELGFDFEQNLVLK